MAFSGSVGFRAEKRGKEVQRQLGHECSPCLKQQFGQSLDFDEAHILPMPQRGIQGDFQVSRVLFSFCKVACKLWTRVACSRKGTQLTVGSTSCACGGKNKKCFSCLVAGHVKPKKSTKPKLVSRVRTVHQQTPKLGEDAGPLHFNRIQETYLEVQVEEDGSVVCEDCGMTVKNLDAHRRKVHGGHRETLSEPLPDLGTQAKVPKNPLFTLVKCAVCGSMVGDLAKHMKKAKHLDFSKKRTHQVLEMESGELVCPFCPSRWPNRLAVSRHVIRTHGKQARLEIRLAIPRKLKD